VEHDIVLKFQSICISSILFMILKP